MGEGLGKSDIFLNIQQDIGDARAWQTAKQIKHQLIRLRRHIVFQPVNMHDAIFNGAAGNW